jgi:hypothetical protein
MPYQITLPDGSIGMIDDSVPKDRAMEAAEAAYPDAFPGIGEQLLGAPAEFAKAFVRQGLIDPVSGGLSGVYTGLRAAGMELDPFSETSVGKGLASAQEYLAPGYGTASQFFGGLGGLTSLLVPGTLMAKGLARTATLGGMATGLGAEEARGRVEEARAEGIEVTPGQEFTSQLGGGVIGIGDLAPIERLTKPLQAVLRGVKKSDAEMIAPGLFNSAKRMVQTGGIEGLQEGMANVAQDLLAKGIYNPNLEVGDSALGDAAMGASVGAFAQGAIELVTRGRRKSLYESLKTEEEQKTRDAEAEKARLAKETARKQTLTNFGVEGQPLLLAAPQGQITPSRQEKSSLDQYGVEDKDLFEPYGTFTRDELDKDVVKELDKRRDEAGRPKTETFTLQDIADTGVYRGELNRLIAQRSGYTGETKFKPSEVVGLAEQKNIDTSTQGFSDFVGRVTGKKPLPEKTGLGALQGLNDVEIFAVREAINKLPTYEQRKILPAGKAAKIFDDKQATRTLTNIKKTLGQDLGEKGLGETSVLKEIGDFSGLKDVNDQQSLLEKYILDGELERVSTPAFAVLDADGKQISVVGPDAGGRLTDIERRKAQEKAEKTLKPGFAVLDAKGKQVDVDVDQGKAQQKAARIGGTIQETTISGSVKDTTINQIRTPDPVNRLIGGFDIRQGTFEDTLIDGYDITTETGEVIGKTKSLTDAENRVNRATQLREQRQLQLLDAKQKIQENIAKSEQAMADLEALGKKDSEDFKKIQNSMAAQERNLAKVEQNLIEFGKKVAFKSRYKQQKRTGFTLFEGNKPVGTYNSRQEALEASVVSQPTDRLEAMLEAFPTLSASAKPGMDRADIKKLQQVAASELASRKGEIPSGVGITVEGDITAAEERLALQGIFSPRIKERVNELDKKLRAALDKLGLKDVRLNIVGAIKGELGDADGVYAARLIKIALDAENPMRVLRHEGIHALKELGAFTPDQWRVLENKAKSEWMAKYNIADPKRYGSLSPEIQLEEAIAEAFADFSQTKPPAGLIGNVFSRIKSFFAALDNGFKGLGFQTADDVFGRVERGELLPGMGERAAEVQGLQAQRVVAETPERYQLRRDPFKDARIASAGEFNQVQPPQSLIDLAKRVQEADASAQYPAAKTAATKLGRRLNNEMEDFARQALGREPTDADISDLSARLSQFTDEDLRDYIAETAVQPQEKYQLRDDKQTVPLSTQNPDQRYSVRQAPPDVLEEAQRYYEANGILPYTQETITSVGVETKPEKFSLKREGKYGNHDVLGIPVNKNGTVTLYFPADNDIAREVMRSRKLVPTEGTDRIYLTNESSAKTVLGNPGNISQQVGGANVLVQIDPGMLQIDQEYEDGRIDFFIPVKEGKAFFDKMKLTRLFTVEGARNKGFDTDRTLNQVGDSIVSAVDSYMSANAKGRQAIVKQARDVLREQHNIGTLLGENGKLEKTRIGDYGLTYEGQSVASLGLGLASAQRLNTQERVTTCPKSAICEGLCLGDTSGQNQLYGGEDQFRQGPRLSQYLKTEALMLNPEAFGVLLSHEIQSFVNKTKAMDYQPAIRLNVTSDIPPKVYKAIIDAFPNVMFYDYTKLFGNKSIAPNHHLTYSSSGASQRVGNELIVNKLSTWDKDVQKLLGGDNVAMAFTSRKSMPKTVRDEKTGENFEVWNGDNYDARFLDPKRDDGKGYIIGLTNKDRTVKPEEAAKQYDGFFMDYDPKRDGDTLIIKDQARLNAQATQPIQIVRPKERYSLRGANTPEFREWFGNSTIVNEQGSPRVMYHGTARDITEFKAKQAGAIFVTEDPRFAEDFSYMSEMWMIDHADQFLSEQEIKKAVAAGVMKMAQGVPKQKQIQMLTEILQFPIDSVVRDPDATEIRNEIAKRLPSKPNILPVYVRAERPFDFENQEHLNDLRSRPGVAVHYQRVRNGDWSAIEEPAVQEAIQDLGFDGFYIKEGGRKNLAVYDPNQLKSVTGNIGTYGQREPTEAEAADFGMTKEEASAAQKRGDLRYSLRSKTPPPQNIQKFFDQAERLETTSDISDLRDAWIGGVSDSGLNEAAYYINDVPGGKDYTKNVQKLAKQMLGNRIKGFRLMSTEELENIRAGDLSYYAAFTLDPNTALSFANFVQNRKIAPKNLVVVEADINPGDIHMIGKDAESEVVVDMFKLGDQKVQEFAQPVRYSLRNTDTPAFKQWFGDSKVAGSDGKPTVVYTGTSKDVDFSTFKVPKSGVWFTESQEGASQYALENDSMTIKTEDYRTFQEINTASRVIPAYLRIDNPAKLSKEESDSIRYAKNYRKAQGDLFDRLRSRGHDGVEIGDGTWVVLKSPNQIKSAIGNTGEFSAVKSDIRYSLRQQAGQTLGQSYLDTVQRTTTPRVEKGFKDRISEAMSATPFAKFRQMFINKYERIEYFSKQLAKQFGDAVLLADQSAIAAALMSDRAAGVAAESFKSGIPVYAKGYTYVDNMGGKVKGLMEILMPLAQKQDPFVYQMYQDYAARRRGVRLDSEGKITPFTRQELSEIPNIEKAFPEFKQVFEDYQRYNEGLVRYMRDTGVIDAKAAQEWMRYGDYVPFYRQLEGESTVGPSIFSAISGVKAPKKLKGGDAPLGEFLETVVRNSRAAIEAGMRNVAANRVVNNFQSLNSPSTGGRLVEKTSEQNKNRPDVVTVRENGKDAYYKVADPLLVQSLQALNIPQIPGLDILAKPAEFLREMVTRDPAFIGASVLRESLSAWITTGQKLTPVASGVNQFVKILANASPTVQALRRAGIGSGYEFKGDVQATAGVFGDQLKRMAGEMTTAQKAVMPLRAMWDGLDKASTAADLSTRAAVFERVMQETGNEAEAIYQAMEVINFSRKGSSPIIQIFAAIIPFLNARIQGLDLLYRAGFGELASATKVAQQKAFMLRSLALFGTTAMYYAHVQDEEEWQRADQETRDNYWIIGNMKFPIPFELGVIFKVMPERIMAYTMGEDTGQQVLNSIGRNIAGTLSFNPIPQAVLPLVEASSNYSFFLGRDIVGMGKKDLAPEFQTSEGTSQIAIQLGQTLGLSPMKIDYVIRGYTGAMGTYAITAMDSIIRSEDDATKATWRLDQIPVLKRFMISDLGAGTVNEYYDLREKLDEVVRTSNQLERTGNIEALQEYLKDNGQVLGIKDYIRSLDKDMKSLRESRMAINMSRMEPDQKREALDSLRRAEISLTERIGLLRSNLGV